MSSLDAGSSQFSKRQADAIAGLKKTLGTVKDTVLGLVADDGGGAEKPAALRDMGAAVLAYWHRNIPQILLAILTDLMPGWFLGMLMVQRSIFETHRAALLKQIK